MNRKFVVASLLVLSLVFAAVRTFAATTVDGTDKYAYGANIGWINWQGDVTNGAVASYGVLSGYIYSANIGWISLGDGTPASGLQYSNASAADHGVNVDAKSDANNFLLSGYAYSANAGWISFNITDPATRPKIDKTTGIMSGYAYGANIGWIALDTTVSQVKSGLFGIEITEIADHILGRTLLPAGKLLSADTNRDGGIDVGDLVRLVLLLTP